MVLTARSEDTLNETVSGTTAAGNEATVTIELADKPPS